MGEEQTVESPAGGLCPYQRAVRLVREKWTFKIIRAALVEDASEAEDFLGVPGITGDVLSDRLSLLETAGVFVRQTVNGREHYRLSEAGMKLVVILRALGKWADDFAPPGAGPRM